MKTMTIAEFKRHLTAKARELGLFAKRGKPVFKDWAISDEDFLASR